MAGAKKPVNIFKTSRGNDPREVLNWRLWFAVFSFGLMGAARGVDEGLISGVFTSTAFRKQIGVNHLNADDFASVKGNVSAMVNIGSVGGALMYVQTAMMNQKHTEDFELISVMKCFSHLRSYWSSLGHSSTLHIMDGWDRYLHGQ